VDAQDARLASLEQPPEVAAGDDCLDRARRGDLTAFRDLMLTHQARVFSVAFRFTGQRTDAEELLQDVFLQLHGALAQISSEAHLRRWLLRVISHRCIDRLRHAGRRPRLVSLDTLPTAYEPQSAEREADPLLGAQLRQLLLELAPDARAVMVLRFQEDLDPIEIADVLAMPITTVKSHLRRSLEWLRVRMEGNANEP
jgi:RNA polymerase sigma-70 factor (ECF subfamily)